MGLYTFEIDNVSQRLCVIISTPYGLYQYKRIPMSTTSSADFFQSVMNPLFVDLPNVKCFIDDIGIFSLGLPFQIISLKSTKCFLGWRGMVSQ